MRLRFTKMHGLGNDFVVIDAIAQTVHLDSAQLQLIADRHFGIGCDQVLLVERPHLPDTDFHYRIFNADGGEVEQCGNGARCFARFVRDTGLTRKDIIDVGTARGRIRLYLEPGGDVRVNMGKPEFRPAAIPFVADAEADVYSVDLDGERLEIGAVSMGNPHAVLLVDDVASAPVQTVGPRLEQHPRFPRRVNVGFMAVRRRDAIDLRVFERGAGETLACGTGACAAVAVGRRLGMLGERVRVRLPGGELMISWNGNDGPVWMSGPATRVFDGNIEL
jgi:diaminopimelate epimerase